MKENDSTQKISKATPRSPAYPMFSLSEAIGKIRMVWDSQHKQSAHIDAVLGAMGYAGKHGVSLRAVAALNHYGLTAETGRGDDRRIAVSDRAQDILHLDELDPRRRQAIISAAIEPTIHKDLWDRYGKTLPPDESIRPYLIRDKGFNEGSVLDVIKNYRETFEFAKLNSLSDNVQPESNVVASNATLQKPSPIVTKTSQPQELPILIGDGMIARIPFPMAEDDFQLLLGTLNLWKNKLVQQRQPKPLPPLPVNAMFRAPDGSHKPVKITEVAGEANGIRWFLAEDGTRYSEDALVF